ncbi:MAG: DUF1428 domain-containing protein [Methylobacteriaceae bacterium]|nr:DUF1428 domain-containing protein [Methylobacteriaceae bacterium]
MTGYYDLFVAPVPEGKVEAFRKQTEAFAQVLKQNGARTFVEVEADDAKPGRVTSFPQSVKLEPGEKVFVGIVGFDDRKHRDEVMAKAMQDKRLADSMSDGKAAADGGRMFFGGFKVFLDAARF